MSLRTHFAAWTVAFKWTESLCIAVPLVSVDIIDKEIIEERGEGIAVGFATKEQELLCIRRRTNQSA